MKRTYRKPQMKAVTLETQGLIASSPTGESTSIPISNEETFEMGVSGRRDRY